MRRTTWPCGTWAVLVAATLTATATARAQAPAPAPPHSASQPQPASRALATHQIDRFEAIAQVRQALVKDPKNVNDWIILGELAQEVAADVPSSEAAGYDKLAREAYESALRLRPNDANLKAAAQFAREQEQGAEQVAQSRRQAAGAYLAARRRELATPGAGPTLRVYSAAAPYTYQPYTTAGGQPYTYQQYSRDHYPPADVPVESNHPVGATERGALVKPGAAFAPP